MLGYEIQESPQTLTEGIAEYYAANPGLADVRSIGSSSFVLRIADARAMLLAL